MCVNCLRYLLVGCCKPRCGALAATCAGGKRPLTATTRLKALPRPPPLRGGCRGVVSYRVRFVRELLRVRSWVAAGSLVGCCGFARGLLRVRSWVAAGLLVGCCGFARGLLGPRCATRRGLRALWRASALPAAAVPARLALWVRGVCSWVAGSALRDASGAAGALARVRPPRRCCARASCLVGAPHLFVSRYCRASFQIFYCAP